MFLVRMIELGKIRSVEAPANTNLVTNKWISSGIPNSLI